MQMYVLQENLIFMAGLIAIAKSIGNLKKGRIKKKKRDGKKSCSRIQSYDIKRQIP